MEGRRDDLTTCERIEKKQVFVLPRKESFFSNPTNKNKNKNKKTANATEEESCID